MKTLGNMASMALVSAGTMLINVYVGMVGCVAILWSGLAFTLQVASINPTPAEFATTLIRIFLNSLFPAMIVVALGAGPFLEVLAISGTLISLGIIGIFWFKEEK